MSNLIGRSGSFYDNNDLFQEIPKIITPEYSNLPLKRGDDGFDGDPFITTIPNYTKDTDPGYSRMAKATDPEWLDIINLLIG